MAKPMDRKSFETIIREALTGNGVDPDGAGPVPIEKMTAIARDARAALEGFHPSQDDVHHCLDALLAEVMDKSMTEEGRKLALDNIGNGFGMKIVRPN